MKEQQLTYAKLQNQAQPRPFTKPTTLDLPTPPPTNNYDGQLRDIHPFFGAQPTVSMYSVNW